MNIFVKYAKVTSISFIFALGIQANISSYADPNTAFLQATVDWDKFSELLASYLDYPSTRNAGLLSEALPKSPPEEATGDRIRAFELLFSPEAYPVLKNEIFAGDRNAVEVAFRLLNTSDGFSTTTLLMTIGALIRINPRLFLEVVLEHRNSDFIKKKGYPVYSVGPGYYFRLEAQKYELEMRIKALQSVQDQKYNDIRKACIEKLMESIHRLQ